MYKPNAADNVDALNLIIFNDGPGYLARAGAVRATTVLDNMIDGELAPTLAVFVSPGLPPNIERRQRQRPDPLAMQQRRSSTIAVVTTT